MIHRLAGRIVGVGFASGHRVVIGHWDRSPIGPFVDVMWAHPDGERLLFVADQRRAAFIGAVYRFDRIELGPVDVDHRGRSLSVTMADRAVVVRARRSVPIMGPRPRWVTRYVEGPIARRMLAVETYGVSPTGVHEWYQARWWAPLGSAVAVIGGTPLGEMGPVAPPCGFGFSEPPRRPSITEVRPKLYDPSGDLDAVVAGGRRISPGEAGPLMPGGPDTPPPERQR